MSVMCRWSSHLFLSRLSHFDLKKWLQQGPGDASTHGCTNAHTLTNTMHNITSTTALLPEPLLQSVSVTKLRIRVQNSKSKLMVMIFEFKTTFCLNALCSNRRPMLLFSSSWVGKRSLSQTSSFDSSTLSLLCQVSSGIDREDIENPCFCACMY